MGKRKNDEKEKRSYEIQVKKIEEKKIKRGGKMKNRCTNKNEKEYGMHSDFKKRQETGKRK